MLREFQGKLFLVMIFIFFSAQGANAQTYRFEKTFGDAVEGAFKIVQLNDSGYIFTYTVYDSFFVSHLMISRVSRLGNLIWSKQFTRAGNTMAVFGLITDGKFCIASVNCENHNTYVSTCLILKIDTNGGVIWEKEAFGFQWQNFFGIAKVSASQYVLVGAVAEGVDNDCYILSIDSGGNFLWSHRFGDSTVESFSDIQFTSDHNLIIVGTSDNPPSQKLRLVKIDTDGNILWNHRFIWTNSVSAWSIRQTMNHDFIIAGVYLTSSYNSHPFYPALFRFDSTGHFKWLRYYLGDWMVAENFSSKETTDGGIISILEIEGFPQGSDPHPMGLLKTDADGNPEWSRLYLDTANYFPWEVLVTSDDGFALIGSARSFTTNVAMVKTDFFGKTSCQDLDISLQNFTDPYFTMDSTGVIKSGGQLGDIILTDSFIKISDSTHCFDFDSVTSVNTIVPPLTNSIFIFPNPTQTQLTITLTTPANEVSIRVFDLQGRMIALPTTFANTQAQLNTATLPDGFYTLQITNNKTGENEVGKFVKQ